MVLVESPTDRIGRTLYLRRKVKLGLKALPINEERQVIRSVGDRVYGVWYESSLILLEYIFLRVPWSFEFMTIIDVY